MPAWSDLVGTLKDEKAQEFAKRYTSVEELAKGALSLRQMASQREGWVKVPADGDPDEVKAAWAKQLGVPEGPEGYGVTLPTEMLPDDESKARFGQLLKAAHENGESTKSVDFWTKWYVGAIRAENQRLESLLEEEKRQGATEMRGEWGADYDRQRAIADRALIWGGAQEADKLLSDVGLKDHPVIIRMFAKFGAMMAPHVPQIAFSDSDRTTGLQAIQAEEIERKNKGTFNDPDFQMRRDRAYRAATPQQAA